MTTMKTITFPVPSPATQARQLRAARRQEKRELIERVGWIVFMLLGWTLSGFFLGRFLIANDCLDSGEFHFGDAVYVCGLQ